MFNQGKSTFTFVSKTLMNKSTINSIDLNENIYELVRLVSNTHEIPIPELRIVIRDKAIWDGQDYNKIHSNYSSRETIKDIYKDLESSEALLFAIRLKNLSNENSSEITQYPITQDMSPVSRH